MAVNVRDRLASIIIPCWNQLEYTRSCLPALVRNTRRPWELIFIDNGSTAGTGVYLAGVQDVAPVPVTFVSNAQNLGFPAAINQGLKAARGHFMVLLNNDAVVTDGWLNQLTALADGSGCHHETRERHESAKKRNTEGIRLGLVGPMSNYASPPQLLENVPYANLEETQGLSTARDRCGEHRNRASPSPRRWVLGDQQDRLTRRCSGPGPPREAAPCSRPAPSGQHSVMAIREFLNVDPRTLHLPTSRLSRADPVKLHDQVARFGKSVAGMPPLLVYRGSDGELMIYDGVTRATRLAKLLPGATVRVEVMRTLPRPVGLLPTIGDKLP